MTKQNKNLIAYCGLYCGDCHGFQNKIPDLARDLRKELRSSKYDKFGQFISKQPFGKPLKHYKECYQALGMMVKFRCRKGCKNGGGNPFCKIRKCCQKNNYQGCWECDKFEACKKLNFLKPVHNDAHIKNLRKIKKQGVDKFITGKRCW